MIFNMVGGGGGSSTKSTIIVSIETGSTVAAYSDSSYQTLVKTASEKTTGEYWLTGLDNGTYYLKATKGGDVSTLTYTISQYGVYRVVMGYQVINYLMLYDGSLGDATLNQCPSVTGGYVATNYFFGNGTGSAAPTLTFNTSNMYYKMTAPSSGTKTGSVFTTQGIANIDDYILFGIKHYFHHIQNGSATVDMVRILPSPVYGNNPYGADKVFAQLSARTDVNTLQTASISITDNEYLQIVMWSTGSHTYEGNIYDMFIVKADDTAELATRCGLTNTTTDTILASSADISTLFSTQANVANLGLICTGDFMVKAITNSDFMSAYNASYFKSVLDANTHWAKFLAMVA